MPFSPSQVTSLYLSAIQQSDSDWDMAENLLGDFGKMLTSDAWNARADVCGLAGGLQLMLGDVAVGAKTPVMVSKVMAWRQRLLDEGKLADSAWDKLTALNETALQHFKKLDEAAHTDASFPAKVSFDISASSHDSDSFECSWISLPLSGIMRYGSPPSSPLLHRFALMRIP